VIKMSECKHIGYLNRTEIQDGGGVKIIVDLLEGGTLELFWKSGDKCPCTIRDYGHENYGFGKIWIKLFVIDTTLGLNLKAIGVVWVIVQNTPV